MRVTWVLAENDRQLKSYVVLFAPENCFILSRQREVTPTIIRIYLELELPNVVPRTDTAIDFFFRVLQPYMPLNRFQQQAKIWS